MFEAPNLETVKNHNKEFADALCCIVFAPKFSKVAQEGIIPRIVYLDSRSDKYIHFYCAGYGAWWNEGKASDMEEIGTVTQQGQRVPWFFSQKLYSNFVDELEEDSSWKYQGDSELLIFSPELEYSQCLIFNISEMLKISAIDSVGQLFEDLIRFAKSSNDINKFDGSQKWKMIFRSLNEAVTKATFGIGEKYQSFEIQNIHKDYRS
ncbi:MAG: hypothetical protein ACR2MD_13910 [Aridibacter sp.]